jgi:hypothetical protein
MSRYIPCFAILLLLLQACGGGDCMKGEGDAATHPLDVPAFHGIRVEGPIDVVLMRAEQQDVMVDAQENIAALFDTEVRDGIWYIRTVQCFRSRRTPVVHLSVPHLSSIAIHGAGDVTSDDIFETEEMFLEIAGSGDLKVGVNARLITASIAGAGDMRLNGRCDTFESEIHGAGDINAADLQSVRAKAEVVGSGDMELHVTDALEANVTGSGNIRYKGSPSRVVRNVTGSGDISAR